LADNVVPRHELLHFATRLGADVTFFASGAPAAVAWGRGERLFRIAAPPPAAPALVALPSPPLGVATPDAYRWWDQMHAEPAPRGPLVLDADAFAGWGSIGRLGGNDFEIPVFGRHPPLRALYERLAGTHPYWVRLCGSGGRPPAPRPRPGPRRHDGSRNRFAALGPGAIFGTRAERGRGSDAGTARWDGGPLFQRTERRGRARGRGHAGRGRSPPLPRPYDRLHRRDRVDGSEPSKSPAGEG